MEDKALYYYFFSLIQPRNSSSEVVKINTKKERLIETLVCAVKAVIFSHIPHLNYGAQSRQCMGNTEFLRCGGFYFAVSHSQLHVGETLLDVCQVGSCVFCTCGHKWLHHQLEAEDGEFASRKGLSYHKVTPLVKKDFLGSGYLIY